MITSDSDENIPNWNQFFDRRREIPILDDIFCIYEAGNPESNVFLVLLHGCGHTSMSWALVATKLKSQYGIIAFDFRGHGETKSRDPFSLSMDTLVNDALAVIHRAVPSSAYIVLVGHSLGGAVAVHTAATETIKIAGVAVLDVVEGTAIPALAHMPRFLAQRPKCFDSVDDCIRYITTTGTIRSQEAAKISVPYQLWKNPSSSRWEWRTDLAKSEPYWRSWYQGLTQSFISLKCSKLLILAGTDRMDKDILVCQMQGKLQVEIIAGCHSIQEDSPRELCQILNHFVVRNRFSELAAINAKWSSRRPSS